MAVKRNINVSSTISRLDRRIHGVESRAIALSGASGIVTTTAADDQDPNGAPGASLELPPYTYRPVTKAYIYGGKVTGNTPRLELYFSEDPEIVAGDTVRLQGLHGTSTDNFELSPKSFRVFATDTPPWTNDVRATQPWRNTPTEGNNGETVEYTVWFNPVVEVPNSYPSNAGRELITTRRIDSISATGSTVTVTFNSTHLFEVGDVVYIDSISIQTLLFGVDGLFKVSEVVSNTVIKYELSSPLQIPLSLTSAQIGTKYVYPVAQRFVEEGTIWIDKGVEPNRVYVWKEYRWYDTADPIGTVTAQQDGIAPSPVTNLEGETEVPSGSKSPVIDLTWTPPNTRSNGSPISGFLGGYDIRYKRSTAPTWETRFIPDGGDNISSYRISEGLEQNFTYNIEVYVVDIMSQRSTAATVNVLTATYSEVLNPPAAPTVTSKLGTITVDWSGLDSTGNLPVKGVLFAEIHESTTAGFTPSDATLVESIPISSGGNYAVLTGRLFDNTTFYYYRVIFVREINSTEIVKSEPSAQSAGIKVQGVTGPDVVANSITTNNIEAGFVTAELVRGQSIIAQTPGSTRRVEIKASGITAYPTASPTNYSFELQSQTGNVKIVGGNIKTVADANRGVEINPDGIVVKNSSNVNTFTVSSSTGDVEIRGGSLKITSGANLEDVTAITDRIYVDGTTEIDGGVIRTGTILASQIGSGEFPVDVVYAGEINANKITTGSLNVSRIGSGTLPANVIYAGEINADKITSGTLNANVVTVANLSANSITSGDLVGRTIRTVPAGSEAKRIILNTAGEIVFFNTNSSVESGRIEATDSGLSLTTRGSTQLSFDIGGSQIAYVSSSGMGFNGIDKRWIGSLIASGGLQAGNGNAILASNGNITGEAITAQAGLSVTGSITGTSNCTVDNRFRQFGWSWAVNPGTTAAVHRATTPAGNGAFEGFFGPTTSDARFKENVEELQDSLSTINQLRPVKYNFISESESPIINYGLIAQEVRPLFEENSNIVNGEESDTDYLSIEYIQLVAPMIKAIQELSAKNDALEARLAALEGN